MKMNVRLCHCHRSFLLLGMLAASDALAHRSFLGFPNHLRRASVSSLCRVTALRGGGIHRRGWNSLRSSSKTDDATTAMQRAHASMSFCAKTSLASAGVDVLTFGLTDTLAYATAFWKVAWAVGLVTVSRSFFRHQEEGLLTLSAISAISNRMARLWRWSTLLLVAIMLKSAQPARRIPWACGLIGVLLAVRLLSEYQLRKFLFETRDQSIQRHPLGTYFGSLAVCTAALLLRAAAIVLKEVIVQRDKAILRKALDLINVLTPLTMARLLQRLRHAALATYRSILIQDSASASFQIDDTLFEAQNDFYAELGKTMRKESIVKVVISLAGFVRLKLL